MDRKEHWDRVYSSKEPRELTWFQPRPESSLALIRRTGLGPDAGVLDVGAGTSLLTASLLGEGYHDLSVLDVSPKALEVCRTQMGDRAKDVRWLEADLTAFEPKRRWDLWHDRAVYHFLTEEADRVAYSDALGRALEPGGHLIIAAFDLQGPLRCSGLEVVRYSPESLLEAMGSDFTLRGSLQEAHPTPSGGTQSFMYAWFQRVGGE